MPTYDSMYAPLNGREIKNVLKTALDRHIEKIPLLKEGSAFHKCHIQCAATITAYPADVPVPSVEFEESIEAKATPDNIGELEAHFSAIEKLEDRFVAVQKFNELGILLEEKLRKAIDAARPQVEIDVDEDGTIPDKVRIAHGLNIPVIGTEGGKRIEMSVSPKKLNVKTR